MLAPPWIRGTGLGTALFSGSRPRGVNASSRRNMSKPKPHLEFVGVDLRDGWEVPPGYPPGFTQKVLASDLDEAAKRGSRTRLLRIAPGAYSIEPFVHDHWEEVFLLQGDLVVGNDSSGQGGKSSQAFTYACRPQIGRASCRERV